MDEHQWAELFLKEFCFGDAEDPLMRSKPTPMLWSSYFLHCMKLNKDRGTEFSKRCVQEIKKILEDTLTTLQELVLEGDPDTVKIQIKKQLEFEAEGDEDEPKPIHKQDKAALHYAVITGNLRMVELLLNEGFLPSINQGDVITKFTPLHLALFIESSDILWLLLRHGALFTLKDAFFGTPLDYARMLNIMPNKFEKHKNDTKIHVYNPNSRQIDQWDISTFEKTFQVQWCPFPLCTHDYIEELMFSGFTIQTVDTEFRSHFFCQLLLWVLRLSLIDLRLRRHTAEKNTTNSLKTKVAMKIWCWRRSMRKWGGAYLPGNPSKRATTLYDTVVKLSAKRR
jgi:hypothetical protein